MNRTKTSEQITKQIGNILSSRPQVFGMTSEDVNSLTLTRATQIVAGAYEKNKLTNIRRDSDHQLVIEQLQVEHSKLMETIEALDYIARHDVLTGLPNRKELDRRIKNDITTENTEVVFMIFDLRKFKYINDTYGHEIGDKVLIFVAGVCKKLCKLYPNSLIARKGGDEFTGMFPNCNQDDISGMADNFMKILDDHWKNRPIELQIISDPIEVAMGLISLKDQHDVDISVKQKGKDELSPLEIKISKSLYKADKMSEAAKNIPGGIITKWDEDYRKEIVLNDYNKELLNKLNGIIRHWISDESVDQRIREIRELLASSLNLKHIVEELERINTYLLRLNMTNNLSQDALQLLQQQIEILRTQTT